MKYYDYGDVFGYVVVYPREQTTSEWFADFEDAQAQVRADSGRGLFCFIAEMIYVPTNPVAA